MSTSKYILHAFCLFLIQLAILDNIQLSSYVYINVYVLAILILPYSLKKTSVMLLAFLFGFVVDWANGTMGIHTAAATCLGYLRPKLLQLTSNREQINELQGTRQSRDTGWFMRYMLWSVFLFNILLVMLEAFSFSNFGVTLIRIFCSAAVSIVFILLYYLIALKKSQG